MFFLQFNDILYYLLLLLNMHAIKICILTRIVSFKHRSILLETDSKTKLQEPFVQVLQSQNISTQESIKISVNEIVFPSRLVNGVNKSNVSEQVLIFISFQLSIVKGEAISQCFFSITNITTLHSQSSCY